ncbi:MAG: FimV/HubP family polar landmark protein [Methylophaga sp.]
MTQKRIVSLSVVAALGLLSPLSAYAFGLGQISVNSALNQPFEAEIPVTSLRATERGNLDVRLASPSDFDRAGLDRSLLLTQLRFEVIEQGASARVKITSQVPIKEPFLDFLITASAGEGRMLREYTVLLDPPSEVFRRSQQPSTATSQPFSRPTALPVSRPSLPADRYQVRKGDTLWQIAQQNRPAGDITTQQMMMALLAANPEAFQRNNINGLRSDVTLQIPDSASIRQLSPAEANAAVNEQLAQWQNRNQQVSNVVEAVPETAKVTAESTASDASNEDDNAAADASAEQSSAQQLAEDTSRLQLVAAADDGDAEADPAQLGDPDVQELNEQLTLAQETIEAQNQENIDFKARMDAMEEQLETMRRLLSLKDEDMARLQSMLEDGSETATDSQPLATINTDEDTPPSEGDNDTAAVANDNFTDTAMDESAEKPAAANYLDAAKSFVNNYLMEILLGFLLFLLLVWLIVRHRRQEQTWEEAVGTDSYEDNNKQADLDDADSNNMVAPEVSEFVSNTEQPEKTVDELVEQADMFVGYADYVQARTALEQAHQLEPENKPVAAKLLFVLFKQNKANEFNSVLAESDINETDSQWSDVSGWGLALMPDDARFKARPAETESPNDNFTADTEQTEPELESEPASETDAAAVDISDAQSEPNSAIDFDVTQYQTDDEATEAPSADETADLSVVDFDDGRSNHLDEKVSADDLAPIHLDLDDNDSDFADWQADSQQSKDNELAEIISLDDDDSAEPEIDSDAEKIAMQELDVDDVQDDLDFDLSGFDEVDEAETKLDLAAAYVDMGDPDGARGILQEVLGEGTDEQKQRAQVLLDSLT